MEFVLDSAFDAGSKVTEFIGGFGQIFEMLKSVASFIPTPLLVIVIACATLSLVMTLAGR